MSIVTARVPIAVASSAIFFALGVGAGMAGMVYYGYHYTKDPANTVASDDGAGGGGDGGAGKGKGGGAPGKGGGGPGAGKGGGQPKGGGPGGGAPRGPSPKVLIAGLVTKLDQLTQKPLTIKLTDEQKKKVREQLQGLSEKDDLSDDEAKIRLDALKEILKDNADTLEAAGYRFSTPGGGPPPPPPPNPFKEGQASEHLKSLDAQLKGAV
jgi:hypothetical protein